MGQPHTHKLCLTAIKGRFRKISLFLKLIIYPDYKLLFFKKCVINIDILLNLKADFLQKCWDKKNLKECF